MKASYCRGRGSHAFTAAACQVGGLHTSCARRRRAGEINSSTPAGNATEILWRISQPLSPSPGAPWKIHVISPRGVAGCQHRLGRGREVRGRREITGGTDVSPPLPGSGSLEAQRGPLMTVICHFAVCCSLPVSLEPAPRKINIIYSRMHCFQILNTQISVSALQRHLWI